MKSAVRRKKTDPDTRDQGKDQLIASLLAVHEDHQAENEADAGLRCGLCRCGHCIPED